MAAICDACGWSGMSTSVSYGCCPKCREPVRYESKPLQAAAKIADVAEFNRRAVTALRPHVEDDSWTAMMLRRIERGLEIPSGAQNALYKIVLRKAGALSDRPLVDFATFRAKGAD